MRDAQHKEIDFYDEISKYIFDEMKLIFESMECNDIKIYYKFNKDFRKGLKEIVSENQLCGGVSEYADQAPSLKLDIFFLFTDGDKFEILVLEVKYINSMGLNECSQLIGYNIVSNSKYGILINVDDGISEPLFNLSYENSNISKIVHKVNEDEITHLIGIMKWNSISKNMETLGRGNIKNFEKLAQLLIDDLTR